MSRSRRDRAPGTLWRAGLASPSTDYSPLTKSLLLDGVDEQVNFGNVTQCAPGKTDPMTWGLWFKISSGGVYALFSKYTEASSVGWTFFLDAAGAVTFYLSASAVDRWSVKSSNGYADSAWHSVCMIDDGSNVVGNMDLLMDGVSDVATATGTLTGSPVSTGGLRVGVLETSYEFPGNVCHSSIHAADLSAQAAALWGAGAPQVLPATDLVHHCALGDGDAIGSGNMIDLSSLGNNGTTVNVEAGDFVADVPP